MTRVLLADDHELIRFAIRTLFSTQDDIELVGEASTFHELISLSQQVKPNIILLDLHLKDGDATPKIPEILKYCSSVLILTLCKDRETHLLALRLGAIGIVTKDQSIEIILKAIRTARAGEVWIDPSLTLDLWRNFTQADQTRSPIETTVNKSILTTRELEVARLAARGLTAKKIAAKLFISDKTVRNQLVVIYSKLGVSSHVELVFQAANLGLLSIE